MTKKHFRALAKSFHEHLELRRKALTDARELAVAEAAIFDSINLVANVCASTNPRFDRDKFITACKEGL